MSRDKSLSQLEKAALILDAFPAGTSLGLADVCTRTGLARSTVHRLLVDLAGLGWIDRSANSFELGIGLFQLGERVAVKSRLRSAAMPFMQDLFAVTGHTVHLAVRDRHDAVYIEKLQGHLPLPLPSQIGGRLPLTCTGVGKALLAGEPADVRADVLAQPLRRFTNRSITDPKKLARELDDVRRTGVAVEREESSIGGCCVASPIISEGRTIAALSVSVPADTFRAELLAPAVRTAALAMSRFLAHRSVDRSS